MKECPDCYLCFDDEYDRCPNDGQALFISHKCAPTLSGRYILEKRLGKGGMGTVFKAKHKFLRSAHAIKIISPEVVREDETLLIRFKQEAILAASIHHPNVVNVTDFGVENEDTPYLVMEFIEGISLDEFIRREKRLSPEKAFEILAPIALGVSEAHNKGITHRDLKPLNVMLKNGRPFSQAVKVLDFGLAKMKSTEASASLIQAKTTNMLGSPMYMSPEQWSNEGIDHRADIYSLGVIAFQLLAGELPFKGESIVQVMYQHLQVSPPVFSSFGVSVPPKIESVIRKALAKDKENRFNSAEDFLTEYKIALLDSNKQNTAQRENTVTSDPPLDAQTFVIEGQASAPQNRENVDLNKTYQLAYLTPSQNETLATYFNQPKSVEPKETEKLAQEFIHAQNRVEEARTKISEADKLALEFNEAKKAAENARQKVAEAQKKLEEDVRRRMQAEMESKLAAEREAREKAEAEAQRLVAEAEARKAAEERANALAATALEAQQRAEEEHQKAEDAMHQMQLEEGTRRKAEEAALKLAQEVSQAKKQYEEAKREAENEAYFRMEAEIKRKKVEEEIHRLAEYEAERRKIAEAQAAQQIKEQASRLEKQALQAEEKANEARLLAESEAQKREEAESARKKAEAEAQRLAEEIIEAQKRLEEAREQAKFEAEKRLLEEEARKKAEESARFSLLENQQNVESLKQILISQIEAAQLQGKSEAEKKLWEEAARKRTEELTSSYASGEDNAEISRRDLHAQSFSKENASQSFPRETVPGFQQISLTGNRVNTASSDLSNTSLIPAASRRFNPLILAAGVLAFLLVGGVGGYFVYRGLSPSAPAENSLGDAPPVKGAAKPAVESKIPNRVAEKMVLITGGNFEMGRNDVSPFSPLGAQFPAHTVPVDSFYLDSTEVTNKEYVDFVRETKRRAPENWQGYDPPPGQDKFPVAYVSRLDAQEFADWLSKRDNTTYRLPTEEEWEYAARSGNQQNIYPWGNEWMPNRANIDTGAPKEVGTSGDETSVGKVKDMLGNVMEWTGTTFMYYPKFPKDAESKDIKANIFTAVRGVSFTSEPIQIKNKHLLLTFRQGLPADTKFSYLGFRLVWQPNNN